MVVGDGKVGKTSLITAYGEDRFPEEYIPTVADNYKGKVEVENDEIDLTIWDTAGQDEFSDLRPLSYNNADVFVICFSLSDKESLDNAVDKWKKEIFHLGPSKDIPIVLCGTKSDLRDECNNNNLKSYKNDKGEVSEIVQYEEGN